MSQRDLVAELRAAHVWAPPEVRERVRLIAAAAPAPRRRLTWRRALVVAVPLAAAVAATVVVTRPTSHEHAAATVEQGAVRAAISPPTPYARAQGHAAKPLPVPSDRSRVQTVGTSLSLRTPNVSDGVKRAVAIVTSLGGYPVSVHAETQSRVAVADLTLKVPRAHVQTAMARLSRLGTIVAENVDVTDKTAGLNATDRLITRLQKQLAALRAANAPKAQTDALTARIAALQRSEAATRRAAHYATVRLHLQTPAAKVPAKHRHGHGPLHGVGVALKWLGIGAVYALALGTPLLVLLALVWLVGRVVRRRRVDALLSRS
jgi:Domain of unknown function (DUF4349)